MDRIVQAIHQQGRDVSDLLCEVLSTMPYPLERVLQRYSLGRFRVTQKANLKDPEDVYRSESAQPADWIMVGNHDTAPIWKLAASWKETGIAKDQATYLAERLKPESERAAFVAQASTDLSQLVTAKFADLFASKAQNVMVFFSDWFGFTEIYNAPGVVSDDNWTLRLSSDWQQEYRARLAAGSALNLPAALALALRAPGATEEPSGELADRLEQLGKQLANVNAH
jgi:4-alpha-glucanotransferase